MEQTMIRVEPEAKRAAKAAAALRGELLQDWASKVLKAAAERERREQGQEAEAAS